MTTAEPMTVAEIDDEPLYEAELPRTGYRPAVDYLVEALQGQGRAIAKHVDSHLTNEKVFDLASAIDRAIAVAVRRQIEKASAAVLALQVEVLDELAELDTRLEAGDPR